MRLRLRTLGGLHLEGTSFSGPKSLALLAYLALEGPKERAFVAELFWLGSSDPLNRLSITLSRLRSIDPSLFAVDGQRVGTRVEIDVADFLGAAERRDHEVAIELYGGSFLGRASVSDVSVELEEWVHSKREFLAGVMRTSLVEVALRDAAIARYWVAAKGAERAVALEGAAPPSTEELTTLYSLLLAGNNPYARVIDDEELGQADAIPTSVAEARDWLQAEVRSSERQLPPPAMPTLSTGTGLFLGREEEQRRILELLADPACRLLNIVAPGGMGKTRLALEVAAKARSAFPDGVCVVSLAPVREPGRMADAIADALGIRLSGQEPEVQLLRALQAHSVLLLLDNLEHLKEGGDLLARIAEEAPAVTILATSRERLNLSCEWLFPLHGLRFPDDDPQLPSTERKGSFEGLELFEQSARRPQPDFRLDADSLPAVVRICRAVGGMPLAIELAAGWLDTLTPDNVASEVQREIDILETSAVDVPERHRSMATVFASSFERLLPGEREFVARLSVFAASFDRRAAEVVAGADLRALRSLSSKSFVSREGDRYVMHELLKQYAWKELQTRPVEAAAVERAHAEYYLTLVERSLPAFEGPEQRQRFARLAVTLPDIQKAWRTALERGEWAMVERAATGLSVFLHNSNRERAGAEAFGAAFEHLERAGEGLSEDVEVAILASFASFMVTNHTRLNEAEEAARRAVEIYEDDGSRLDPDPMCHPYFALCKTTLARGDYAAAKDIAERLYRALQPSYPVRAAITAHAFAGTSCLFLGEFAQARRFFEQGYAAAVDNGEDLHAENYTPLLGNLELQLGELDKAEEYFRACLEMSERHTVPWKTADALYGLASVALTRGETAEAESWVERGKLVSAKQNITRYISIFGAYSAEIALRREQVEAARPLLRDALQLVWTERPSGRLLAPILLRVALYLRSVREQELEWTVLRWVAGHPASRAWERTEARHWLGLGQEERVAVPDVEAVVSRVLVALNGTAGREA